MIRNKLFLLLSFLFFIFSCNEESKTTFSETNITTDSNTLVEINIPIANGNNLVSFEINSEIHKAIIATLQLGEPDTVEAKSLHESIDLFNKEYKAFNEDFPESGLPWEAQIDGEIMIQSPQIISIALTSYVNTGGAHGITTISFLNFDAISGKRILNKQLFTNEAGFKIAIKPYFDEATKDNGLSFDADSFQLPSNIGYSTEGIILLYSNYDTASFATEIIDFTVPYEKVNDFLVITGS